MTRGMAARLERWGDIEQARLLFRLAWEQERQAEFRAEHGTVLAFPQRGADLSETRWKGTVKLFGVSVSCGISVRKKRYAVYFPLISQPTIPRAPRKWKITSARL